MDTNEVATLLGYTREKVVTLIETGLKLPKSGTKVRLAATKRGKTFDVTDRQLNSFIAKFEAEEPGRHPGVEVRRELLVEAKHRCAVCRQPYPLQFHHMVDWAKIKHHDASQMLAICELDHGKCTRGEIDYPSQLVYKTMLLKGVADAGAIDPLQEKRRQADYKTLRELFVYIPRPRVAKYLDLALDRQIICDVLYEMELSANSIVSPLFHLYDKELWKLLREFFSHWNRAGENCASLHHDDDHDGIARPLVNDFSPPEMLERYEQFQRELVQANHSFFLLNSYIREQFPDLDLEETDQIALRGFAEAGAREERRIKALLAKHGGSTNKKAAKKKAAKKKVPKKKGKRRR